MTKHQLDQPVSGHVIRLAPGDVLEIRLVQQSGGGYLWSVAESSGGLELIDDRNQPGVLPGAAAARLLTFRAGASGTGRIVLAHARSWEPSPVEEIELAVEVSG